ncbi:alpha/beta fold hydrolase [Antrihabitans sp. YC2-6]|uniref:alpha/beta fold hydrolase n=1 Tax=Antrihabitans sp. YC2-6 TaxID=2799498 RepID=UPI0018F6EF52|nr:alpha/beta fold hydrolase [Antrihabitans sp. YC2-6]MBJ8348319.1 alpha/beta fold hydrolase [Antrihabitans sp. YC2-6]
MADVTASGVRFHVERIAPRGIAAGSLPTAPTVVFMHGMAVDDMASFYFTLAAPLAATGADVILYDQRGQGLSERPRSGYTIDDAVADLFGILDAMAVTEPVVLIGNSFGGFVAGHAAFARPERVAGIVFIEAICAGPVAADWVESMVNSLSVTALNLEHERTHEQCATAGLRKSAKKLGSIYDLLNGTTLIEDLAATPPLPERSLAAIECPTLAIFGEHSFLLPAADDLVRNVPDCAVEILPDVNHSVLVEATGPLCALIVDWLVRLAPVELAVATR